jgi:predicted CoA-binding protein
MSNIIPIRPTLRADVDETAVTEQVQQIPGELDLDRVIKAQLSAPEVAQRITELEDCLWAVAQELRRLDPKSALAERAGLVLKNRLEI